MRRPGPLQELPLDQFLPLNPNLPFTTKSRPNKRPLSPGGPNLYSPAKRRILNAEGIFSPEKTIKSPISARGTPAHFMGILSGPSSPAKKLDFGAPKHSAKGDSVLNLGGSPARPTSLGNKLAPSPELKSNSQSSWSGDDLDDYFSMPNRSSSSRPSTVPTLVPREMPPPPDPQSIHYPVFRVHCDTRILLTPVDDDLEMLSLTCHDKYEQKENTAPRRKPHKVATAPNTHLQSQLFSPDTRKREIERLCRAKSTPATPNKLLGDDRQDCGGSPTPRRPSVGLAQAITSSTPRAKERDRQKLRRAFQDEVDDADEDEGDEA